MLVTMNDEVKPGGRIIMDRHSPALTEALWRLVREAKGEDALAPVTVVGPTRYANLSLRQELGRTGFVNVRFLVLPMLSEMLGGAAMGRAGRRPLTPVMESVALRAALAQATGPLAPVSEHPSTLASLRTSFRELRKTSDDVLDALEGQAGVRGEIVRLYRNFRQQTANGWYDIEDLAEVAAEAVRQGDAPALDDLGLIIFHLPRDISPAQIRLIEALGARERCAVLLGLTGDTEADRLTHGLADALRPTLGVARKAGGDAELPLLPGDAALHVSPNAHEELRWVIRQIVQQATIHGTPFHRMAILYGTEDPYGTLIRDELRLVDIPLGRIPLNGERDESESKVEGIPMAGPSRDSLADTAVGRTLSGLLRLATDREFGRGEVIGWLTGCPIRPPAGRAPGFNPSRWDAVTRKAGIVAGLEQWSTRLENYAKRLTSDATEQFDAEEINEARAGAMRSEATAARNAQAFVEKLAEDLKPPVDGSRWESFCQWAEGLLDIYLSHDVPQEESDALEQIRRILEELRAADSIAPAATMAGFRHTVEESLRAPIGHLGVTGQGVFVSPFAAAAGMSFDAVWLVGMIEGQTPPGFRPDPLLPESDWQAAGGRSRLAERAASERYVYLSALSTAPRRTLSYPVADASSQREAYPSRWFLEQATALEGERVHTGDLPPLRSRAWLTISESGQQALATVDDSALADRHDYHLHRLLRWQRDGHRTGSHPLAQTGTLARATRLRWSRNQRRLTEFDGNLSGAAAISEFGNRLRNSPVSATSLQSWATCPFSYFLGHVLRLSALETPEDLATISALERGSLVHDILEEFVNDAIAANDLPAPGESWSARSRQQLARITEEQFRQRESSGVTGKPLLWELDKQDISDDLETFLEDDETLRARHSTALLHAEANFGMGKRYPRRQRPTNRTALSRPH